MNEEFQSLQDDFARWDRLASGLVELVAMMVNRAGLTEIERAKLDEIRALIRALIPRPK
jgi:hypothetical protein